MLHPAMMERLLNSGLEQGADFAEVYCEQTVTNTLLVSQTRVESCLQSMERGVGIRLFDGLSSSYAYTNECGERSLLAAVARAARNLRADGSRPPCRIGSATRFSSPVLIPFRTVPYGKKLEIARRAVKAGMDYDSDVTRTTAKYLDFSQQVQVANTEGCCAEDDRSKTRLFVRSFAERDGKCQSGYYGPGAMAGMEFYESLDVEQAGREAARIAVTLAGARDCPSGKMPVVIGSGFSGILFHEACGHSLEAGAVARGASEFSGQIGRLVAAPCVTLVDDGALPGRWGSLGIDDEGTPTCRNVLIEHGILQGYLADRLNARRMGAKLTGSARRQNYRFAPVARMTNTFLAAGKDSPLQILSDTERGLYIQSIRGGSVNPVTGEFNFSLQEAYLIENGVRTTPVRNATLIGTGSNVLRNVDRVGDDIALGDGFCYSESGALFVDCGEPTIRVQNMTVGGVGG